MSLNIQKFMRSTENGLTTDEKLEKLFDVYKISSFRSREFTNLIGFKYTIKSSFTERISYECRGIILDEADDWRVICYPYNKFFNFNEGYASDINWNNARIYEKLDGSMICLWYYNNQWRVSTTGTADAGGFSSDEITFKDLFNRTWETKEYRYPDNINYTYIFELLTPFNQIVVKQESFRLVLHGVRDNVSLQELDPLAIGNSLGYEVAKTFKFSDLNSLLNSSLYKEMDGREQEGFVVVDNKFNRIKIKCADYFLKHRIAFSSPSIKDIIVAITTGVDDDLVSIYPELAEDVAVCKNKIFSFVEKVEHDFALYKHITDQKEFALKVKDLPYSSALFLMRRQGISAIDWLCQLQPDKVNYYLEESSEYISNST